MKKKLFTFHFSLFTLVLALALTSCDEGNIEDSDITTDVTGKTVKMTAHISGVKSWDNTSYSVAVAAFSDGNYAVTQRMLPSSTEDGSDVEMVLSNLSSNINTVELIITNRLRERILSLSSVNLDNYADNTPTDTIFMNLGTIDVDLLGCMQYGIFDKACIQCHGGNGRSAADLNLTEGNSYNMLVDHASTRVEGAYRVKSGDPENSVMRRILNEGGENILHYNHTEVLSSQFKENLDYVKQFIDMWINSLGNSTEK